MKIKIRIIWGLFYVIAFIILLIANISNIKYLNNLINEFRNLIKKHSKYIEDGDYRIIKKRKR